MQRTARDLLLNIQWLDAKKAIARAKTFWKEGLFPCPSCPACQPTLDKWHLVPVVRSCTFCLSLVEYVFQCTRACACNHVPCISPRPWIIRERVSSRTALLLIVVPVFCDAPCPYPSQRACYIFLFCVYAHYYSVNITGIQVIARNRAVSALNIFEKNTHPLGQYQRPRD